MSLTGGERLRFFFRSLTIMGSWNFPRMQGLGFFYVLSPHLEKKGEGKRAAMRRHFTYFNTHPYMASYVLGAVAALEERGEGEKAVTVRNALMGPLGAAGDGLFWAGVKPLAITAGLVIALFSPVAGIVTLLVLYNLAHLAARWVLFDRGYGGADEPLAAVTSMDTRRYIEVVNRIMIPAMGFLLGLMGMKSGAPGTAILIFLAILALHRLLRNWIAAAVIMVTVSLVLAWLGVRMVAPW